MLRIIILASFYLFSLSSIAQDQSRCGLEFFQSTFSNVNVVASEWLTKPVVHCRFEGRINERVSEIDKKNYAIGFELRLPANWNQRFLFQGNGGNDGRIVPAFGASANHSVSALAQGFAVISTDAGHQSQSLLGGASFGLDPQARLDYGYQANQNLTPLSKTIIEKYYQQAPTYSYFMGCSNGGRHAMVAASRLAKQFDGFIAGDPGFNLPKAAVQHAWDIQTLSVLNKDLSQSLSQTDLDLLSAGVLAACDKLDQLEDGMVQATSICQQHFNLDTLVCDNNNNKKETCLSSEKVKAIEKLFAGPSNSEGDKLYSDWPFDVGVNGADWRRWKINSPIANLPMIATLGAGSLAEIFVTPPTNIQPTPPLLLKFLREFDFDNDAAKIYAASGPYTESAISFMTPPNVEQLPELVEEGSKLLVYHGASDGVFSVNDTIRWYQQLDHNHQGKAADFARLFVVPGMNHCASGPATDQFDLLTSMVNWVEHDQAPDSIVAKVNPNNPELPASWSKERSRLLCSYPKVAYYDGTGDKELASNFSCK